MELSKNISLKIKHKLISEGKPQYWLALKLGHSAAKLSRMLKQERPASKRDARIIANWLGLKNWKDCF